MGKRKYTQEQVDFLLAGDKGSFKTLADAFNAKFGTHKTYSQIKNTKSRIKLYGYSEGKFPKCVREYVKIHYKGERRGKHKIVHSNSNELAKEIKLLFDFDITPAQIVSLAYYVGVLSIKTKPLLTEIVRKNRLYIKVAKGKWIAKAQYVYEKAYGKLPKNYHVILLDGSIDNCELDNLIAIPHGLLGALNYAADKPLHWKNKELLRQRINAELLAYKVNRECDKIYGKKINSWLRKNQFDLIDKKIKESKD